MGTREFPQLSKFEVLEPVVIVFTDQPLAQVACSTCGVRMTVRRKNAGAVASRHEALMHLDRHFVRSDDPDGPCECCGQDSSGWLTREAMDEVLELEKLLRL